MQLVDVRVDGARVHFTLRDAGVRFANALRRALMQDVSSWAPDRVTFVENTTCQPDEFIAHRIGQIPMRPMREGASTRLHLSVSGRDATTADLVGEFASAQPITIMRMREGQTLECVVEMRRSTANEHARWGMLAAVGYEAQPNGDVAMHFETINGESPMRFLREGLEALRSRCDGVLSKLAA